jgi:hypothetical protein
MIVPTKLSFWCKTRSASRVTAVAVRMVLAMSGPCEVGLKPREGVEARHRACSTPAPWAAAGMLKEPLFAPDTRWRGAEAVLWPGLDVLEHRENIAVRTALTDGRRT